MPSSSSARPAGVDNVDLLDDHRLHQQR